MFASDSSSRMKIGIFPRTVKCLKPCPWVTRHDAQLLDSCMGLFVETPPGEISRPVKWLHDKVWPWTLGNTFRLTFAWWKMARCIRPALTCMMLTFCAWYDQRILRETGEKTRETGAKKRGTGAKRKCVPLDPLVLTVTHVFEDPFCAWSAEGMVRRESAVVLSVWGTLFQPVPWQFFHHTFECTHWLILVLLRLQVRKFLVFFHVFMLCARFVLWCVVTVVLLCCILKGFFGWEMPDCWCGVVWNLRCSWRCVLEVSWCRKNIRDVEVDTSDLPCPKFGCSRCNPCRQACLVEVVFGMLHVR